MTDLFENEQDLALDAIVAFHSALLPHTSIIVLNASNVLEPISTSSIRAITLVDHHITNDSNELLWAELRHYVSIGGTVVLAGWAWLEESNVDAEFFFE